MKRKQYCMILDDDQTMVDLLKSYVDMTTGLVVAHAGTDPRKALERIERINVDILIIDMEMPRLNGLDFLAQVKERVQGTIPGESPLKVIVCSAHRDYAVDTFGYYVSDFLLKPLNFPRFIESINRVRRELMVTPSATALTGGSQMLLVKTEEGNVKKRVDFSEIIYLEANGKQCRLWLDDDTSYVVPLPLGDALLMLPRERFMRVHRSFAISYAYFDKIVEGKGIKMRHIERTIPTGRKKIHREYANWYDEHAV